jgi:hypothetical protein
MTVPARQDEAKPVVDQLTPTQKARLQAIRDNWIAIGLSTDEADRPRAEAAVKRAYRRAGLSDAVRMIWTLSPMSGAIIAESLTRRATRSRTLAAQVKAAASLQDNVAHVVTPAMATLIRQVVMDPVSRQVTSHVWRPINDQVARTVRHAMSTPAYGQHDAPWLAFADVLGQAGADVSEIEPTAEIAQSSGWWWPFDDVCVLSDRHSLLARDDRGRLHAAQGPAVMYPDGWSVYSWHGIVVDPSVVMHSHLITVAQIQAEPDLEVRRVLLERYGTERYLADSGTRTLPPNLANVGSERRVEIGGSPATASETAPVELDRITPILRR